MGRRPKPAPGAPPRRTPGIAPLQCSGCGAPLPIGDGDAATCKACGQRTALPPEYVSLRDACALSEADAARLDALASELARPTPLWKSVAIVVGFTVGGLTLLVMALGALVGAIAGLVASDKAGDGTSKVFAAIGALLVGLMSVPFVGEWVTGFVLFHGDLEAVRRALHGPQDLGIELVVAAVIYFLGVLPTAIAWRTRVDVTKVKALRESLAAKPASWPGGGAACRHCGAPLEVRPNAPLARCLYCGADNLLTLALDEAKRKKGQARALSSQVDAELAVFERARRDDRKRMRLMLALGPLLVPLVCGGGWLLHALLRPTH